ncbi:MAG: TIGR00725 family protein [Candidatus Kariarchaeaceae archaeon]|jgi:uncharacterized protein (TIGR00725 family)
MRIGIIGSNEELADDKQKEFAYKIGKVLIDEGFDIINGGMGGIMAETARGARKSTKFTNKSVIGILPSIHENNGNPYSGVIIKTDMGSARNRLIVLNCHVILAIGGGSGTLNEISTAWELNKPIMAYVPGGGWATKLAGQRLDQRRDDIIVAVESSEEILEMLRTLQERG